MNIILQSAHTTRTSLVERMIVPHLGHIHRRVLLGRLGGFAAPPLAAPGGAASCAGAYHILPGLALCHLDGLPTLQLNELQ